MKDFRARRRLDGRCARVSAASAECEDDRGGDYGDRQGQGNDDLSPVGHDCCSLGHKEVPFQGAGLTGENVAVPARPPDNYAV